MSLRGEESRDATGQMGLPLARTQEGKKSLGEAHGCPPALPDLKTLGSAIWEPEPDDPKVRVHAIQVRRRVLDKGASTRPDPRHSPGIVIIDPDACLA